MAGSKHVSQKPPKTAEAAEDLRFGVLDLVRVIGGLLFFNALVSYYFTSSTTWGYDGKYIDPRFWHFKLQNPVNFTLSELALYNGSDVSLPIYVAVYGKVYDVTSAPQIYGPSGAYKFFSGKDGARAFSTGCFNKPDEFTYDLRGLDMDEAMADVTKWQAFFENHSKYWYVGTVVHEPIQGDPPGPCKHMKYPGHR
jgi:predicted heme/steroid binding protein